MNRTPLTLACWLCIAALHFMAGTANAQGSQPQKQISQHELAAAEVKTHEPFIRKCYELAMSAASKGNHPFGSLLVHQGKVVATSENTVNTDNDFTRHAELNLIVHARRTLSRDVIRNSTLYTSTAPCSFCSQALSAQGITRIVYGVHYAPFNNRMGIKDKAVSCETIYEILGKKVDFIGPVLESEGLEVFDHWPLSDEHGHRVRQAKPKAS